METQTYQQVIQSVKRILNIDLSHYKDEQMKRRLDSWLVRNNISTWNDYFLLIRKQPEEMARFRDYLTINVTEFFRDPERWQILRHSILPGLLESAARRGRSEEVHIWSAGCSIGIEAFTLSILLYEVARTRRYSILATDLDHGALTKARARGPYREEEVRSLSNEQRLKYLDIKGGQFYAKEFLVTPIKFMEHDLNDQPFGQMFDLIVCRNVIIYFTNDTKTRLYQKFYTALRPGGVLFLGGTEIIPNPREIGFKNLMNSFYIKE